VSVLQVPFELVQAPLAHGLHPLAERRLEVVPLLERDHRQQG
jgi:hypothetical protein